MASRTRLSCSAGADTFKNAKCDTYGLPCWTTTLLPMLLRLEQRNEHRRLHRARLYRGGECGGIGNHLEDDLVEQRSAGPEAGVGLEGGVLPFGEGAELERTGADRLFTDLLAVLLDLRGRQYRAGLRLRPWPGRTRRRVPG